MLDSIENGETVMITRAGSQVAKLVPTPRANGAALAEVLRSWQDKVVFGEESEEAGAWVRAMPADLHGAPWRECSWIPAWSSS